MSAGERNRKLELELSERIKKAQREILDIEIQKQQITSKNPTVSNLREIGGGVANESANILAQQRILDKQDNMLKVQEDLARENLSIAYKIQNTMDSLQVGVGEFTKSINQFNLLQGVSGTAGEPINPNANPNF